MTSNSTLSIWAAAFLLFLPVASAFAAETVRFEDLQRERLTRPFLGTYALENDLFEDRVLSVHRVGSTLQMALIAEGHKQTFLIFPLHLMNAPETSTFREGFSRGTRTRELNVSEPGTIEATTITTLSSSKTVEIQRLVWNGQRLTATRKRVVYHKLRRLTGSRWIEDTTSSLGVRNRLDIAFNDLIRLSSRPFSAEELGRIEDAARAGYAKRSSCEAALRKVESSEPPSAQD